MKNIITALAILCMLPCIAMEDENKDTRKNRSPGPTGDRLSKRFSRTMTDGMVRLSLKVNEIKEASENTIAALISDRRSSTPRDERAVTFNPESPKRKLAEHIAKRDSQNSSPREESDGEIKECVDNIVVALTSSRSGSTPRTPREHGVTFKPESPKNKLTERITKRDSRNSSPRTVENNRIELENIKIEYEKTREKICEMLEKIKTLDQRFTIFDCMKELKNARFYRMQIQRLELPGVLPEWIEPLDDEAVEPVELLQNEYDKRIALLTLKEARRKKDVQK
jgi:hypothetical protein